MVDINKEKSGHVDRRSRLFLAVTRNQLLTAVMQPGLLSGIGSPCRWVPLHRPQRVAATTRVPPTLLSVRTIPSFLPSVLLRSERGEGGVGVGDKKWFGSIPSISAALGLARVRCAHKVKESTKLARPRTMRLSSDPTVPFVPYCVVLTPIEE